MRFIRRISGAEAVDIVIEKLMYRAVKNCVGSPMGCCSTLTRPVSLSVDCRGLLLGKADPATMVLHAAPGDG